MVIFLYDSYTSLFMYQQFFLGSIIKLDIVIECSKSAVVSPAYTVSVDVSFIWKIGIIYHFFYLKIKSPSNFIKNNFENCVIKYIKIRI